MLKVELHAHSNLDPLDGVPHTTRALIDHAAALGYRALAVTCHDRYFDPSADAAYASARGILLLAGIERTIDKAHVLLINFPPVCQHIRRFEEIPALKRLHPDGLVIAPHALFPIGHALGFERLDRFADLWDAVEVNALYTRLVNFNRMAIKWAHAHGKPLVGNSDVHALAQMGTTYSLVDSAPDPNAICAAIRRGRVRVESQPLSTVRAASHFAHMLATGVVGKARRTMRK